MKKYMLGKALPAVAISMLLGIGISACNKAEERSEPAKTSNSSIEESVDRAIDDTQEVMSDSWITTKVKSELMADDLSEGFDVKVDTKDGVVSLEGTLLNQDAIDRVSDLAASVKGVKRVNASQLVVQH